MARDDISQLPRDRRVADGLPLEWFDRRARPLGRARWHDGRLLGAWLDGPGGPVELVPGGGHHPVLGATDRVVAGAAEAQASATDWARPAAIPTLDDPARLPAGAGSAILGFLAERATGPLRYRGPYPTAALFDGLLACFTVAGDAAAARARFTAGAEEAALLGRSVSPEVDFVPAPFERWRAAAEVWVDARATIERVFVAGRAYRRGPGDGRRLVADGAGVRACLVIGGAPWREVVALTGAGEVVPHAAAPSPSITPAPLGPALRRALRALLVERAPRLLAGSLARVLDDAELVLGDPGDDLAAASARGFVLHGGLVQRLDGLDLCRALALALEPVAHRAAQARLAAAFEVPGG